MHNSTLTFNNTTARIIRILCLCIILLVITTPVFAKKNKTTSTTNTAVSNTISDVYVVPEAAAHYTEVQQYYLEQKRPKERPARIPDKPIRRMEITFFISLPLIYWDSYLLLQVYNTIVKDNYNFGEKLPDEHDRFINVSSLLLASYITYTDYLNHKNSWKQMRTEKHSRTLSYTTPSDSHVHHQPMVQMPIIGIRF